MTPTNLTITMRRNENPYTQRFNVTDDGVPVDMTPYVIRMFVRLRPGAPGDPLLSVTTVASAAGSVFVADATGFELEIYKDDLDAIPQDTVEGEPFVGAYDMLMSGPGGDEVWFYGDFVVVEGVTTL